jgi:predicted AAA+ superfamily ATPase
MPKLFFLDLGLRNLVVKQFGELGMRPDRGALIENFAFIHLYRGLRVLDDLHFWRTKNGAEVDFIVQTGETLLPIEVKYQALKRMSVPTGMQSFLSIYPSAQAAVITRDAYGQKHHHNTKVIFLPAWLLGSFG